MTKHEGIIKVPKTLDINVPGILTLYVAAHNVGRRAATRANLVQWEGDGNFTEETASDSEPRDFGVAGPNLTPTTDASACFQGSRFMASASELSGESSHVSLPFSPSSVVVIAS